MNLEFKKKHYGFLLATAFLSAGIFWKSRLSNNSESLKQNAESEIAAAEQISLPSQQPKHQHLQQAQEPLVAAASPSSPPRDPASATAPVAKKNLEDMTQTLFQFTRPGVQIRDLVEYLQQSRQEPSVVHDSNPDTGEMAIVRTKSPLPGTRYFHAQYMTGEDNKGFVQHMSFEFQPSPSAMNEAISTVQKMFPQTQAQAPEVKKDNFVRWSLDDHYIVWVKKMDQTDLQDNPFNAYTDADIGTIRVAVELEVHAPGEHGH